VKKKTTISTAGHGSSDKKSPSKRMNLYANLAQKHKTKKDKDARERAEYLATLPKHPVKRFFYRLHPKRLAKYWFSKRGGLMALKILGVSILLMLLLIGGMFAYFRKDLDKIRPGELAKRVQTTVTKYYDRNDNLLWEDKGTGNYQLVVESDQISDYLKKATVAIEDRNFYNHHGISISGMLRAMLSTASRRQVQGGSTLTQQLVKQVFFADEAGDRSISGIPRKIKEIILAIEVERMYSKDQILSLYLNESPYGGRRNGAESAAQTYFGKHAKDLTLAEAALIAGIPQNPTYYNPYNTAGNKALIARQHTVLDYMAEQGVITKDEAEKAKKIDILSTLKPQTEHLENIKAPHFLLMVRNQLSKELGESVVGRGGLTIKTTLDWRIQEKLENEMKSFFATGRPDSVRISNGAATVEDVQTGQIVALVGSRDFNYTGFGQDNAAVSYIQPGSTIKSLVFVQLLADGADHDKRERARFGMDVVKELKDILKSSFELYDDNIRVPEGVDSRLLKLAKEMDAAVLTLDYNLNKVAQVDGVKVLNINELAKSLRMSYLPGDELDLELSQKGQDSHQAVGYLKDGTMVVVENAKRYIGQTKKIEIIRSLQTDAGKMMFAKLVVEQKKPVKQKTSVPKKRTNGRSKTSAQHEAELINLVNKQ
jgi:rRNA-processing protein FCF1